MSGSNESERRVDGKRVAEGADRTPQEVVQDSQEAASEEIARRFEAHPGYGGMRFEGDNETVTLWWVGDVPSDLRALAAHPLHGAAVKIIPATFSVKEFNAESRRLNREAKAQGFVIPLVGPSEDKTHLEVTVRPGDSERVRALEGRIPLVVSEEEVPRGVPLIGRHDDTEPFWGGAAIWSVEHPEQACSTGFSAIQDNTRQVMVTAWHCGPGDHWETTALTRVGLSGSGSESVDAMAIRNKEYGRFSYVGQFDSQTGRYVSNHGNPQEGQMLCVEGAFSGELCNAEVTSANRFYFGTGPGFFMQHDDSIAGTGDSGAPTVRRRPDGNLGLRGLLSQGVRGWESTCRGFPAPGRICFKQVFAVNQGAIANQLRLEWKH